MALVAALVAAGSGAARAAATRPTAPVERAGATTIRIAYPTTTLINGQIGLILERTNILKLNGLNGKVVGFSHGPPQNEALASGAVDVALTSEGPAVVGISQGIDALVFASFGRTRDALVVPGSSPIRTRNDLKGKTIGVPFGTTPFLHLVRWLKGTRLYDSVRLVNIGPEELAAALASKSVDAVEYNEPLPTELQATVSGRIVSHSNLAYAAVMRRDFLRAHRPAAARFMAALADASLFMATHKRLVNRWFAEVSRADVKVIRRASGHSPLYTHTRSLKQVHIGINRTFVKRLQGDADFFAKQGFIKSAADMTHATDLRLWNEASKILRHQKAILRKVKIVR
jgi:ABC-type nitrate/sulfonate/bicarbonate transport system substrate-binding protein